MDQVGYERKRRSGRAWHHLLTRSYAPRSSTLLLDRVYGDSQLIVKQITGEYKVKSDSLRPLWQRACTLRQSFTTFQINHVERAANAEADKLANEAMDRRK